MNQIGLNEQQSKSLAGSLNKLMANYTVFYINVRGYHWNIKGEKFFELHAKFEELYNDIVLKIDEIAERIKTLGDTPLHTFSDYLELSSIKETRNVSNGKECIQQILNAFKELLMMQREILKEAQDTNDEGTSALMSDYIRQQEKQVWMYTAWLS